MAGRTGGGYNNPFNTPNPHKYQLGGGATNSGGGGGGGSTTTSQGTTFNASTHTVGTSGIKRPRQRQGGGQAPKGGADSLYRQAKRDVMLSMRPILAQYKQAKNQISRTGDQTQARVGDIYSALGSQLGALGDPYQQQISGISSDLTANLAGLTGGLNGQIGQAPATERAAAAGLFGAIGGGGLTQLASGAGRNAAYNTSAQRQGVEESAITQRNSAIDTANALRDLQTQKAGSFGGTPQQILARLDALKQQSAQLALARSGNQLNWSQFNQSTSQNSANQAAFAQWLQMMSGGN